MHASVRLDHTLLAVEGEHDVHAMVEIAAPVPPDADRRPPLRLALVLDRSGSMAGPKLDVAKRCATWLVTRLRAEDELALVDYDDAVRLLAPLAPVQSEALRTSLSHISPGGSTNLSGGWLKGLEQLRGSNGDGQRKILLLTDGLANVGIVDRGSLTELAQSAAREHVGTSTIGFGDDFDEQLLTDMADAGGGNAHYAPTPDAAPAIFAQELEGLMSVVAQNVSLEIRPRAQVELLGILNDYPHVPVTGGVQIQLGDAYGGERRRVVFGLHVPYLATLGPVHVADVVLRYVSVGSEIAQHELTLPLTANAVSAAEAAQVTADSDVEEEVLVLKAARARDEAIRLADRGEHAAAQRLMKTTARALRAHPSPALHAEADQLEAHEHRLAPRYYAAAARKQLHFEAWEAKRGRK